MNYTFWHPQDLYTSEEEKQQIGSFYSSVAIVCLWILVLPAYYKVTKKVGACADPVFFFRCENNDLVLTMSLSLIPHIFIITVFFLINVMNNL